MTDYEFHPYSEIYSLPALESREFLALCDSLLTQGMLVPVVLYQDKILDGRTRYLAHKKHPEIELRTVPFEGTDQEALNCSLALNNERRNLSPSQLALAAWRWSRFQSNLGSKSAKEIDKDAKDIFRAGERYIKFIGAIANDHRGDRQQKDMILDYIDQGLDVPLAHSIVKKLAVSQWQKAAESGLQDDGKQARKWIKGSQEQEKAEKVNREFADGARNEGNEAVKTTGKLVYPVIYCDPNWKDVDAIRALEIPATTDCTIFLWSPANQLDKAIEIVQGWGFTFQTIYVWNITENRISIDAEILLQATKGKMPDPVKIMPPVQSIGKQKEGKPPFFKTGITAMHPTVSRCYDMFGTGKDGDKWNYGNPIKPTKGNGKAKSVETTPGEEAHF